VANQNEALVRKAPEPIAIYDPGLAKGDEGGMDAITSQDIKLAFLAIAQKTSKVLDRSEGKYIAGLEFGEMYNSETSEIYGAGPIEFLPVLMKKRARLLGDNGLLGDEIPWDDPRGIPPWEPGSPYKDVEECEAVRIYDWAIVLLPSLDQIVLSFKSTSFTAGKSLNSILDKYRKMARAAGKGFRPYQVKLNLSTFIDKNESGSYGKFRITLAGAPGQGEYTFADAWYESIKNTSFEVADETAAGSTDEDAGAPASTAVEGTVVQDGKVPF
jgi:hypothetical protein